MGTKGRAGWTLLLVLLIGAGTESHAAGFRLLKIDGVNLKWGLPEFRSGASMTYGFADADHAYPDAINCRSLAPMARLEPAYGDAARLDSIAAAAFAMWSAAADVRFRRAEPGERPDILIGAQGEPTRIAYTNVWHGPGTGIAPLTRATICFNPEVVWSTDPATAAADSIDLATVLAHEIGHAIGLDHPGARGELMGYSNQGSFEHLMPGDIAGAIALYGAAD